MLLMDCGRPGASPNAIGVVAYSPGLPQPWDLQEYTEE